MIRVAGLLLLGSIGCAAISLVQTPALFIPAVIAVSATAWSSNALYTYAVVKRQAHAPAKASGLIQIGNFVGSAIGPFIFGLTMEQATMSVAWLLLAGWLLLASGVVLLARRTFGVPAAPPG